VITVPRDKPYLRFVRRRADKTILTYDNFADMPGPDGRTWHAQHRDDLFEGRPISRRKNHVRKHTRPWSQASRRASPAIACAFRQCRFLGWQDTLLIDSGRPRLRNCYHQWPR